MMKAASKKLQRDVFFSAQDRNGLYKAIFGRRDVRGQFKPDPVPDDVLGRILTAAHHAPSVGFMQPWNFIVIKSDGIKKKVRKAFDLANEEASMMFEGEKREVYRTLKLEGILESPVNICVTCDRSRSGPVVIGRTHIKTMDLYSCVCAVQNLWLAARAEGLGVGWVSILHQEALRETLEIPRPIVPIAYLCLGYVTHFHEEPELQSEGWLPRLPLDELVYFDAWGKQKGDGASVVLDRIRSVEAEQACSF
jgi:5,6-dimethylbenzimidazole synthase